MWNSLFSFFPKLSTGNSVLREKNEEMRWAGLAGWVLVVGRWLWGKQVITRGSAKLWPRPILRFNGHGYENVLLNFKYECAINQKTWYNLLKFRVKKPLNTKVTVTWSIQHIADQSPKTFNYVWLCSENMFWIDMSTDRWNWRYYYKEIMFTYQFTFKK